MPIRVMIEAKCKEGDNTIVSIFERLRTHVFGIAHLRPCELGEVWHICTRSSLSDLGSCLMKDMAGKLKLIRSDDRWSRMNRRNYGTWTLSEVYQ
jgi:hypothetical protein